MNPLRKATQVISQFSKLASKKQYLRNKLFVQQFQRAFCTIDAPMNKVKTENLEFKAETKRLLNIVANALYTDKEVFLRELLSNASDACERQRYMQETGQDMKEGDPLQLSVQINSDKKQIIITDTGIGMTREDMINNLGTICSSGSKKFVESLKEESNNQSFNDSIIGQFGVGFYSAFIVGDTIEVLSKRSTDSTGNLWVSDGSGSYEISEVSDVDFQRGTRIVIHLKSNCSQFLKSEEVKRIIQKYSNFINYPIYINGEKSNIVQAIWAKSKNDLTEEQYQNFYEHIANTKVSYRYKLHYSADVPLSLKALLYIPSMHMEKYGMQIEDMEVSLYSKKILIKQNCKEILPHWLRFVKGVVDCEDIPLNISRENYQDTMLISKLRNIVTKRVLKMISEEANKNESLYLSWYNDFQFFLKEGLATDQDNQDAIMQLVRYQCNFQDGYINMDDYIKKLKPDQDQIYFILAANRDAAMSSPYMESFQNGDVPIIFIYMHVDEMVFRGIQQYKGKYKFVNIETSYEEVQKHVKNQEHDKEKGIPEDDITPFCLWVKNELSPTVNKVQLSKRLADSPAILVGQLSSGMRQVMGMLDKENQGQMDKNFTFEINPNHQIMVNLNKMRKQNQKIASMLVRQVLDNTMITAGLITDTKTYVNRVNKIIEHVLQNTKADNSVSEIDNVEHEAQREQLDSIIDSLNQEDIEKIKQELNQQDDIVIDKNGNPTFKQ